MSCRICERPGLPTICFDCRLDEKVAREKVPDFRESLTEECRSCGGDLTPTEFRQKNCPYCGERP